MSVSGLGVQASLVAPKCTNLQRFTGVVWYDRKIGAVKRPLPPLRSPKALTVEDHLGRR